MKKLIETHNSHLIVCDNPICDYTIPNESGDPNVDLLPYVNMPCPKCGENLLTYEDHFLALKTMRVINWLNKYFSWLTLFGKKKQVKGFSIHVHNGITVKEN